MPGIGKNLRRASENALGGMDDCGPSDRYEKDEQTEETKTNEYHRVSVEWEFAPVADVLLDLYAGS